MVNLLPLDIPINTFRFSCYQGVLKKYRTKAEDFLKILESKDSSVNEDIGDDPHGQGQIAKQRKCEEEGFCVALSIVSVYSIRNQIGERTD